MRPALYRLLTWAATPVVRPLLERRRRRGKEDAARLEERLGHAGLPRPAGPLVWIHGASVGEAQSVLGLVRRLVGGTPAVSVLMTTGTVTSAGLMAARLPAGAVHQYVPVDQPMAVKRFLDHWRPDLAIWVESELWPNLVLDTGRRGVPMALVNGRMSESSFKGWQKRPGLIRPMLDQFRFILAQSGADAARFTALGAGDVRSLGNLKFDAPALGADAAALAQLAAAMDERPRWLAASTHAGEEVVAGHVHARLKGRFPDLLTIIVPRHPERGDEIAAALTGQGLTVARRRTGDAITRDTGIYLADTLGELGLFYRLSAVSFIGGSLVPHGGQNPLEAARLGNAIIVGPHMGNFAETLGLLKAGQAVVEVEGEAALAAEVEALLADETRVGALAAAAKAIAGQGDGVLDRVAAALSPLVGEAAARARA